MLKIVLLAALFLISTALNSARALAHQSLRGLEENDLYVTTHFIGVHPTLNLGLGLGYQFNKDLSVMASYSNPRSLDNKKTAQITKVGVCKCNELLYAQLDLGKAVFTERHRDDNYQREHFLMGLNIGVRLIFDDVIVGLSIASVDVPLTKSSWTGNSSHLSLHDHREDFYYSYQSFHILTPYVGYSF